MNDINEEESRIEEALEEKIENEVNDFWDLEKFIAQYGKRAVLSALYGLEHDWDHEHEWGTSYMSDPSVDNPWFEYSQKIEKKEEKC